MNQRARHLITVVMNVTSGEKLGFSLYFATKAKAEYAFRRVVCEPKKGFCEIEHLGGTTVFKLDDIIFTEILDRAVGRELFGIIEADKMYGSLAAAREQKNAAFFERKAQGEPKEA
jgi:hypothetical protein